PSPLGRGVGVRVRASGASMGGRTLSPGPSPGGRGEQVGAVVEVEGLGELGVFEFLQRLPEGLGAVGGFGLAFDGGVDRPALLGDLGEVADAGAGDEDGGAGFAQAGVDVGSEIAAA